MCGIAGIFSKQKVANELYDSLIHLQHRGQDAAGILTYENGNLDRFHMKKGAGYAKDVFNQNDIDVLNGKIGIAHTRYPTTGSALDLTNAQPISLSSPYGLSMVHNGNLSNYESLKKELINTDKFHSNSTSDLEIIMGVFSSMLHKQDENQDFFKSICNSTESVYQRCKGGYSVIGIIAGKGMIAFRDPHGIRPLVKGERVNKDGTKDYIFAS